jgi:hypothetical protein
MEKMSMCVAVVWRGPSDVKPATTRNYQRLRPIFEALALEGIDAEPVVYTDAGPDLRERLLRFDGALVWVDPIAEGETRDTLNQLLRDASTAGVWVSAHPDTIDKMGTKEVLYRTRTLGWRTETRLYRSAAEFVAGFPASLAGGPRVVKQNRGNGGIGVWKVTLDDDPNSVPALPSAATRVRIQHAAPRDGVTEVVTLADFTNRCRDYFADGGKLIDQPYLVRIAEGMIRTYMVRDHVVGYASQQPGGAQPNKSDAGPTLGLPSAKTMFAANASQFARLRSALENEWIEGLCALTSVADDELPLLWDADFLYGPPNEAGQDTYLLCEINVSSVLPFPPDTPRALARAVRQRLCQSV